METAADPLLEGLAPVLAAVPRVVAVALGGSRATGAAHAASDTDIGLYFSEGAGLGVERPRAGVRGLVDDPEAATLTEVGGWGRWIRAPAPSTLQSRSLPRSSANSRA
jgi:Nucleotidyltransferase domain